MEQQTYITVKLNISPQMFNNNLTNYINDYCKKELKNTIRDEFLIQSIENIKFEKQTKINIDGSISIICICFCTVSNPEVKQILNIEINNINKMGYSYKINKLCIFIPNHFVNTNLNEKDIINVEIIGKRVEKDIVCIAKPVHN